MKFASAESLTGAITSSVNSRIEFNRLLTKHYTLSLAADINN